MKDTSALLAIEDVGYRVGENTILQNVSFCVSPGEFRLITGPSGCGKKYVTENHCLAAKPNIWKDFFDGKDITSISPEQYRQQVSYTVQTPVLFGETVYDNLIFPWKIRQKTPEPERLIADLERFGLSQETLTKSVSELSGGEKQRVSLIRSLQFLPKVLLLDEITSALDDANKRNVNDIIHRYARDQNVAVLWVTHDAGEITHADDVIRLEARGAKVQEADRG